MTAANRKPREEAPKAALKLHFGATVPTAALITALRKVSFAIERKNCIPILGYVRSALRHAHPHADAGLGE